MKTVHVKASKEYDILIENGLLKHCGEIIKTVLCSDTVAIISDSVVAPLYMDVLTKTLEKSGIHAVSFVFKSGEASKTAETYIALLNFLAKNRINRKDTLIALGGGVVGDLTGFAAATFLRGIGFIQIPTTLLACVDSSVGGKTAIDLDAGKNLAGAFYQPNLVICDPDTLKTLDDENYRGGMAEVVKYAIICDEDFYRNLTDESLTVEEIIQKCVEIKRDIVEGDEFDTGKRQLLNFGHTLGHGIEACSHFALIHGLAVAIGMSLITKISEANGICNRETVEAVDAVLDKYNLPKTTTVPMQDILDKMLNDKKVMAKNINLVVPTKIGQCVLHPLPVSELEDFIQKGFC